MDFYDYAGGFGILIGIMMLVLAFTIATNQMWWMTGVGATVLILGLFAIVTNRNWKYQNTHVDVENGMLGNETYEPFKQPRETPFAQRRQMPISNTGMQTNPETTFMLQPQQTINEPFAPSVSQYPQTNNQPFAPSVSQ